MKYVSFILFLIAVSGGVFAITGRSEAPLTTGGRSAADLFSKNCASCHGRDGRAKTFKAKLNHARNLSDAEWQDRVSDERIFNSIMNGKGKMPGYSKKLSEKEIDSLVAYVRRLRK